jgi:hypothetical protein
LSDIFQEIEEDLRRDNLAKLWRRYGKYVIVLAVVVVIATGGVSGWREYRHRQSAAEGVRYADALDLVRAGKDKEAADAFAALARTAGGGHAMLARFEEAALRARSGDRDAALGLYDALAADSSTDTVYREAAALLGARVALDKGDAAGAVQRAKPLTDAGNSWRSVALELTAAADLKSGDAAAARQAFQQLADDPTAPAGARQRATQMLATMGS